VTDSFFTQRLYPTSCNVRTQRLFSMDEVIGIRKKANKATGFLQSAR
jgi:hypothetical protein